MSRFKYKSKYTFLWKNIIQNQLYFVSRILLYKDGSGKEAGAWPLVKWLKLYTYNFIQILDQESSIYL